MLFVESITLNFPFYMQKEKKITTTFKLDTFLSDKQLSQL